LLGKSFGEVAAWIVVSVVGLTVYTAGQLACALIAALRGLSRRQYPLLTAVDLFPEKSAPAHEYAKRTIIAYVTTTDGHQAVNSEKVGMMAVAHVALRNFIIAALALTILLSIAIATSAGGGALEERVIRQLRSDPELIELLRGPRGPAGPIGPPGPPGRRGHDRKP